MKKKAISAWNSICDLFQRCKFVYDKIFYKADKESVKNILKFLESDIDLDNEENSPYGPNKKELVKSIKKQFLQKVGYEDLSVMIYGLLFYRKTGRTPTFAHKAYLRAYMKTSGIAQEVLHYSLFEKNTTFHGQNLPDNKHIFDLSDAEMQKSLVALNQKGYFCLRNHISNDLIDHINADVRDMRFSSESSPDLITLNPKFPPQCNTAHALTKDIYSSSYIQKLTHSKLLLSIASAYLKTEVQLLNSCLWYSFASSKPTSEAAQFYHFDLDTLKWLKVFIYLSDVTKQNGPHEYIEGSHIPGSKPAELLMRGYCRLTDKEIDNFFEGKRKQALGSAGTIVFADTRCFHKGTNPMTGYRLVLQAIYAPSFLSYRQLD